MRIGHQASTSIPFKASQLPTDCSPAAVAAAASLSHSPNCSIEAISESRTAESH